MLRTRKVFLGYSPEDEARSEPIRRALKGNGLNCWQAPATSSGETLSATTQRELERRNVFIRLCSPAMQAYAPVQAEAVAFRQLQAAERQQSRSSERLFVDIILDSAYQPTPAIAPISPSTPPADPSAPGSSRSIRSSARSKPRARSAARP